MGGYRDPDDDQNDAAEEFAALPECVAQDSAEFEAEQGQTDVDDADDDRGQEHADQVGAQGETDGEVVDASRQPR